MKLKKKLSDLGEELKNTENEKHKVIAEKEELQNKISQISDNAKKLQVSIILGVRLTYRQ